MTIGQKHRTANLRAKRKPSKGRRKSKLCVKAKVAPNTKLVI